MFNNKRAHKMAWLSPDGNTQNLIDYIIVNRKWSQSVLDTRTFRGCKVPSDNTLVIAKIRLELRAKDVIKINKNRKHLFKFFHLVLLSVS